MVRKHNKTKRFKKQSTVLSEQFEQIRLELYQHPKENSVKEMADSLYYSLPYFSHLYKKYLSVSPMEDLNNARAAYIQNYKDEYTSAAVLCEALGFTSLAYFYRWFKKNLDMTPKEFFTNNEN